MSSESAIHLSDLKPTHIQRRNIELGTAVCKRTKQGLNFIQRDQLCVCYHLAGHGLYRDEVTGKEYAFQPGSLRLWHPDTPHTKISMSGIHVDKYLSIPYNFYEVLLQMELAPVEQPVVQLGLREDIVERHEHLIRRAREQSELSLPRVVSEAFTLIVDLFLPRPANSQKWRSAMEEAATLLQRDFLDAIAIPELASKLNMSCTNFRRVFASFYGVSPNAYRIQKKLEMIESILITEDILMKEVAEQFGYADVYTFSRQFKKYTGVAPTTFRHRHL